MVPLYSAGEAAHYLSVPIATTTSWVQGRNYPTRSGLKRFKPLIHAACDDPWELSFTNLVEIYVLSSLRKHYRLRLHNVRSALTYVERETRIEHPLAHQGLLTDGASQFIERFGELINASADGQKAMKDVVRLYAKRIDADADGLASRLYPFTTPSIESAPKVIAIDPSVSLGRPFIRGLGVSTAILAERYKAGDSIAVLAEDYECEASFIEEAIRCELPLAA
jgi:uncharacterized protein (DUF433 family)